MIKSKRTFFLGIFIFLVPYLGLPSSWKTGLIILSGLLLVMLSIQVSLPRKASKRPRKKEKITPVFVENSPIPPKSQMSDDIIPPPKEAENDEIQ